MTPPPPTDTSFKNQNFKTKYYPNELNSQAQPVRLAKILKVQNIIKCQIIEFSS